MNIFRFEFKKLWNWRTLIMIAMLSTLTWFAFLSDFQSTYESMLTHGKYGSYQTELFRQYGNTLEPEELDAFDIPSKKEALILQMNDLIMENSIFSDNNIRNFEEYLTFEHDENSNVIQDEQYYDTQNTMQSILEQQKEGQTLDEWYASPLMRYGSLQELEYRYVNYEDSLQAIVRTTGEQPVVVQTTQKLIETRNSNLLPYFLCNTFSLYAAVVGVISVLATLFLVSPLIVVDRSQNIHLLQYSSAVGRRILQIQFGATMISAFILAAILITASYLPAFSIFTDNYWSAPIMSFDNSITMQLYNITFGNYVLLLAGMSVAFCVGTAGIAFVLARFSANIVTMLIKVIPTCALFALIAFLALKGAMSYNWIYPNFLRGKLDMPEIWILCFVLLIGILSAAFVIHREKNAEVL